MKRFRILITVGVLNVVHGGVHVFQFIQSMLLTYFSFTHQENPRLEAIMESPWMGLLWGILGVITLYIGYNDYKHHKLHHD